MSRPLQKSVRFRHVCLTLLGLLASFSAEPAKGQGDEGQNGQSRYRATFVQTPPAVDGDLSDPVWGNADVIDQFTQQEPNSGAPSTEKTEVRLIYDSEALYIGAYCHESDPADVVGNTLRFRDDSVWSKDDVIRFVLDTVGMTFGTPEPASRTVDGAWNCAFHSAFSGFPPAAVAFGVSISSDRSNARTKQRLGRRCLPVFP